MDYCKVFVSPRAAWTLRRLTASLPVQDAEIDQLSEPERTWARIVSSHNGEGPVEALDLALRGREDAQDVKKVIFALDPTAEPPGQARRFPVHSADEALGDPEPVPWVVEPIAARGSLAALTGAPGSKKTWLALDLAVAVATGAEAWLGHRVNGGPVLIIDEESGPRRMSRRLGQALRGHQAARPGVPINYISLAGFNPLQRSDLGDLNAVLAEQKPVLVLVDALADIMLGADENAVKDTQPVFMALRRLAEEHQTAIIVIHHTNKQGGYRGSTAIPGALDLLLMVKSEARRPTIECTTEKCRDTEPFSFSADFVFNDPLDQCRFVRVDSAQKARSYTQAQTGVIEYLRDHGTATAEAIQSGVDPLFGKPTTIKRALFELIKMAPPAVRRANEGGRGTPALYALMPSARLGPL